MDNKSGLELTKTPSRLQLKIVIVTAVVGIVTTAVIILAFTFRVEFGIAIIVGIGIVGAHQYQALRRQYALIQREARRDEAQTVQIEQQAQREIVEVALLGADLRERMAVARTAEIQTRGAIIGTMIHETRVGVFFFKRNGEYDFIPATVGERKVLAAQVEGSEPLPRFLDAIRQRECVCFYGPRDGGKTTAALHWLAARPGRLEVIDPKGSRNPWPTEFVIKDEKQYITTVDRFIAELELRRASDLFDEPPWTLLIDELFYITQVLKLDIMTKVFGLIAVGREWGMSAAFTASGKGVRDLHIEGQSGLVENLAMVHCLKTGSEKLSGWKMGVDLGEGFFQVEPPGPYYVHPVPAIIPSLSDAEKVRVELLSNPNQADGTIQATVWGSKGGRNNTKRKQLIRDIRAELGNK